MIYYDTPAKMKKDTDVESHLGFCPASTGSYYPAPGNGNGATSSEVQVAHLLGNYESDWWIYAS